MCDGKYFLSGITELDDSHFGGSKRSGKRGRGISKHKFFVAVFKDENERPEFLKLMHVSHLRGKTLGESAAQNFVAGSTIRTGALPAYRKPLKEK
ncbi:MAG: transposase [Oscillospiraceae bacterium]|nr:transposase [Oscillospiraceae bacterium]